MNNFKQLLAAYLAAHPNILPPADPDDEIRFERDGLEWKVSVRSGGEIFVSIVDIEELMGWLWLNQSSQVKS